MVALRAAQGGWHRYQLRKSEQAQVCNDIELIVQIADPLIRRSNRYRKQLFQPVIGAKAYCSAIIEEIPGPVLLSREDYFDNPAVKALFTSPEHMNEVVRFSPEVESLRASGYSGQVTALLTMAKEEKTIYGYQQQGDLIQRDIAQRAVNFVDHRIIAPSSDLAAAKSRVAGRGLEALATVAMEKITRIRSRKAELREKQEYLKGVIKILTGKTQMYSRLAGSNLAMLDQLDKAEELLHQVEKDVGEMTQALSSPNDSLRFLDGIIEKPDITLQMRQQALRLNWSNIRVEDLPDQAGNTIVLAELLMPDDLRRSLIYISFPLNLGK